MRSCIYNVALLLVLLASVYPNSAIANQARKRESAKATAKIPMVTFCELTNHPKRYLNRVVKVRASYITWWESSYLYSDSCRDDENKIHDAVDCEGTESACRQMNERVWGALSPRMRPDKNNFAQRVSAVFVGRLVGPGSYGHLGAFSYEFRIIRVEKAESIPDNVPWR